MKTMLFRGVALAALAMPGAAFAQSTGTVDFEDEEAIVVTGTRTQDVGGIQAPDTSKAKAVLTQEIIARQNPGQSILDTINLVPGVSFQNNDAYGSSGGTLNIRGFGGDRISLTFDGIPLNDSGNYAIFSNQQLDPEVIEQVNVNLGTTDVDSPTASAVGGTVNYRTIVPSEELGAMLSASYGEFDFHRVFGKFETGAIGPFGTRAFVTASKATNDNPFNNYGRVNKQQYNGRIYQSIGSDSDFVSVSGNYNQNRNNFFGSVSLRNDRPVPAGFPQSKDTREYNINFPCALDTPQAGFGDVPAPAPVGFSSCGTEFDRRFNPSNTGNVRGASRFSFGPVTLTVDPSYQYVKANGGGTVTGQEGLRDINPTGGTATPAQCRATPTAAGFTCVSGYLGGSPFFGRDINGDGDILDTVTVLAPSQTQTRRYGLIAGLRWDINDQHTARISYTYDRARHRQTGEVGLLDLGGSPFNVFPINDAQVDGTGEILQKRDRLSFAILHQVSGEYRGEFLNEALTLTLGLRAPFFERDLNNFCFTTSASGFVECFGRDNARNSTFATLNPTRQGPQNRNFKYDKLLPNIGAVYDFTPQISGFANYAKGLSVPGTDNLYNSFFFVPDTDAARPNPETTDSFDLGARYRSSQIQAQVSGYFTKYKDRSASAFDPELNVSVFRNLGDVDKYGIDGSVSYQPIRELLLYVFGGYNDSEIKDDLLIGETSTGTPIFAPTAGKSEAGSPEYTFGGSVLGKLGPLDLGLTAKRTGPRFVFDTNEPVRAFAATGITDPTNAGSFPVVFDSQAPAYWLVNADARLNLADFGLENTFFQLNVYNLFDKLYVGGFGGGLNQAITRSATTNQISSFGSPPFVQIGAPRTVSGTIRVAF